MALTRLQDFYQNYREALGDDDIKALEVYTLGGAKIGSIEEVLLDQNGRFRYLAVNTNLAGGNKTILLPVGLARIDYNAGRVYTQGLSQERVEHLPEYKNGVAMDRTAEEQIRAIYQPTGYTTQNLPQTDVEFYDRNVSLYSVNAADHPKLRAYEDRVRAVATR